MSITLKSSEAQQNFGQLMDRALAEDDVVIERYGTPRVAMINYQRYQRLLAAERDVVRLRLQQASAAAAKRAEQLSDAEIDELIEDERDKESRQTSVP